MVYVSIAHCLPGKALQGEEKYMKQFTAKKDKNRQETGRDGRSGKSKTWQREHGKLVV